MEGGETTADEILAKRDAISLDGSVYVVVRMGPELGQARRCACETDSIFWRSSEDWCDDLRYLT